MPIFEYVCKDCGHVTEFLVRGSGEPDLRCSECGSAKLEKKFSTFAAGGSSGRLPPGCSDCATAPT